jgi:hypothetical protein
MKSVLFLLLIFFNGSLSAKPPAINEVRMMYVKAANNEKACKQLIDLLEPYNEKNNPLFLGYKAVATMLMAKYVFFPFTKLSHFNKGKKMLSKSIEADQKNVELRFLRFTVQTNVPSFLNYTVDIKNDKNIILNLYPAITDPFLKDFMLPVLQKSDHITPTEKRLLN